MCIIHCRATRHGCAAKAAAGDDPSSPINGGPHPLCLLVTTRNTTVRLATHAAIVPTANERLNIHAERFHFSTLLPW